MTFEIVYDKQPQQFLKKAEKHIIVRIMDKIDWLLKENPVPHDAKAVVGHHGVFRVRVGDYRALYRVSYQEKKIVIVELDKRGRIF